MSTSPQPKEADHPRVRGEDLDPAPPRYRGGASANDSIRLTGGAPGILRLTYIVASLYALIATIVTGTTVLNDLFAKSISTALPIAIVPLKLNPTLRVDGVGATLGGGGFDHATLSLTGLSFGARALIAGGQLFGAAPWIIIAITLALLCNRVSRGTPFTTLVPRAITVSAFVVLFGGYLSEVFLQFGQRAAIADTFGITSGHWISTVSGVTPTSAYWPHSENNFSIDLLPLGLSLGLFALALVFRYGQRIERDRAALREELRGLV
jgi:hypothetical protein